MPITAKDIARELNLSQPTVSRVLSGDRNHRVSDATRERILEAAKRLRYRRNAVARSLRRGATNIIGLYTNHNYDARNDFVAAIVGGLQRGCEAQDRDLLLHSAQYGRSAEEMYNKLHDGRIDGLILHANADDPLVQILGEAPLPVVAVADRLPSLPSVTCDDESGMQQLIAYLWGRGYRRFAFLKPSETLASVERRSQAFVNELQLCDVSPSDRLLLTIGDEDADSVLDQLRAGGRQIAVCCWNDRTAYNLLRACLEQRISVPDQIAIAGFDGFVDEKAPARRLVTVHCPWDRVALTALGILTTMVDSRQPEPVPAETMLPVTLVAGDTA